MKRAINYQQFPNQPSTINMRSGIPLGTTNHMRDAKLVL